MLEPILVLCSLAITPLFSGFLLNLLDTIALPAKYILLYYLCLHDQPNLDQQLTFLADHEHFYFLSADRYYDDTHLKHG